MENATKVDMFLERWEPFHLQIVTIALKYAYEQVLNITFDQSFQPLSSPTLPPLSPPTTPLLHLDRTPATSTPPSSSQRDCARNNTPSNPDQDISTEWSSERKRTGADYEHDTAPVKGDYAQVPSSEEEIQEEREKDKDDEPTHQEWLEARRRASEVWLKFLLDSMKVDPASLPENPQRSDLIELSKELPSSMQVEIIHDLVILSLSASHSQSEARTHDGSPKAPDENLNYSALDRQLIFHVAEGLGMDTTIVYEAEKLVAQELFFILQQAEQASNMKPADDAEGQQEEEEESSTERRLMKTSKAAIRAAGRKKKWLRYLGAGAGVIVGGVAIGLTGGLAAPVLAPFLVGLSGGALGFLATSGGAILIGTLFGLAGGGLTHYSHNILLDRAQRRLKGIDEFTFERLPDQDGEVDGDLPRIPSLHATIVSTGFLLTPTEYKDPWIPSFGKTIDRRDVYALKVETQALLSAGKDLESYIRDTLLQHGATEIIRHTVLASVCTALLLPASIYKAAVMALDNEYQRTRDICEKAGILLAVGPPEFRSPSISSGLIDLMDLQDMIEQRAHGARPLTLIGSGMGSITVFRAILELSLRGRGAGEFMIEQVILICSPLSPRASEWKTLRRMVTRRVVNVYSKNDWVLAILARLDSLLSARSLHHVAGLAHLQLPHIQSLDVSDIVHGHLELNSKIPLILDRININS
ncbi:hypothetical protein VP01_432g9 [Puccinia sorghi]|uniref:Uncharacterized protein n=1 Tax=Puccinia sorghi TaxID=27349 RepID=A0A0L6UQ02_9BASI|nr:hypothetical protein VP01_432g9 [Puccinia sorghi]